MEAISPTIWAGVDVSKNHWDAALDGKKRILHCAADRTGRQRLLRWLSDQNVTHVCLEATGGWEQPLAESLYEQGLVVSIVNPRKVRDFAKACGQLAKTDAIDARMIARFAAMMQPEPTDKPTENQAKLRALRARRRQVMHGLIQEKNRLGTQFDDDAQRFTQEAIDFYERQLKSLDEQIAQLMQSDAEFQRRHDLLTSVPGIGATTAAALTADVPELGRLNRREAARLAGLAPINRDSGTLRGKRMIGGGRSTIRQALFMATLVATKHNPVIRSFYQRLLAQGKAKMIALVACMRKLLLILNAILKENKPWKYSPNT